jgi:hypothetical protein
MNIELVFKEIQFHGASQNEDGLLANLAEKHLPYIKATYSSIE